MANKIPKSFLQIDSRWANVDYSAKGEKTTIGKAGCGPTCMAMVINTLSNDAITPIDTCNWSKSHGYKAKNQGTYYSYFESQGKVYNIEVQQMNYNSVYGMPLAETHTRALNEVANGNWLICCMGKGNWTSSGHFILWYDVDGANALIHDPNSTQPTRTKASIGLLQKQVKYYFVVKVPKNQPKPVKKEESKEMVEKKEIKIFGKDYNTDIILKDGRNYVTPRVLEDAGLKISNEGNKAIIEMPQIEIKIGQETKKIDGFLSNGTNYASVRQLCEALGYNVDWIDGRIVLEKPLI